MAELVRALGSRPATPGCWCGQADHPQRRLRRSDRRRDPRRDS